MPRKTTSEPSSFYLCYDPSAPPYTLAAAPACLRASVAAPPSVLQHHVSQRATPGRGRGTPARGEHAGAAGPGHRRAALLVDHHLCAERRGADGLSPHRERRPRRGVEHGPRGEPPAAVGALSRAAPAQRPAPLVAAEGVHQPRRDGLERAAALQHRAPHREPLGRTLDRAGTPDARRGRRRAAQPPGGALPAQGFHAQGEARTPGHCLRGGTGALPPLRQPAGGGCRRGAEARADRLSQDHLLPDLRRDQSHGRHLRRGHRRGQRQVLRPAAEQTLQEHHLRSAEVQAEHHRGVCRRQHAAPRH